MANTKKTLTSLGDVLAKFESALAKEAAADDTTTKTPAAEAEKEVVASDVSDEVDGAEGSDESGAGPEGAEDDEDKDVADDEDGEGAEKTADTVSALRQIAKTAAQKEEAVMVKEAEAFGQAMARGFIAELNKVAAEQELLDAAYETGYGAVAEKLAADQGDAVYAAGLDLLGDVVHESYVLTREKLAAEGNEAALADIEAEQAKIASEAESAGQYGLLAITKEAYEVMSEHLAASVEKEA